LPSRSLLPIWRVVALAALALAMPLCRPAAAGGGACLLAECATPVAGCQQERLQNLALAAQAIDGYRVLPGRVFSFNQVVGPRTLEAGYRPGPVLTPLGEQSAAGGGVCQVATTLYNAALRAGLPILERHPHSAAVGYIDPGLDAAVVYGRLDLCFANPSSQALLIRAKLDRGYLRVSLWGRQPVTGPIRVGVRVLATIPPGEVFRIEPGLPPGAQVELYPGREGMQVEVRRRFLGSGREELVSRDSYRARPRVVLRGGSQP
jgi:vancomycin resistance protein YoaR